MKRILVTGAAGFIGFHLVNKLLLSDNMVVGIDIISDYYDVRLKYGRLEQIVIKQERIENNTVIKSEQFENYYFIKMDLKDTIALNILFRENNFDIVINLAAQAGVRYSLVNPQAYVDSNIFGFFNILECCRHHKVRHLVYASSSSVYGLNESFPFSTSDNVDHPISLYAATKKSNELMAHTYSYLFGLPTTGLRFFSVYGPWGRPDMAFFIFTKAILENRPIEVFNNGDMLRDFTYIDDIVNGIIKVAHKIPEGEPKWSGKTPDPSSSKAPYKLYNIGNNNAVRLLDFIEVIEENLGKKAKKILLPLQAGDVRATLADVSGLIDDFGYKPSTPIKEGIRNFISWYRNFYAV
jgi:UDP-glucuronate 4-epimerase